MKKLDKVVDKSPIIYALLLPIVFYLQVGGATILNIHPVIIDLLDLLRIVVIVMFSCYVLKTFKIFENEKDPSMMSGYTEGNKLVHFKGDTSLIGKIIKVKINESHLYSLLGEIIND